jgi:hypothetical protein
MNLMDEPRSISGSVEYQCHNCGVFRLSRTAAAIVDKAGYAPMERARLSYGLRRMGGGKLITSHLLDSILKDIQLPDASSLQDNLLGGAENR